MTAPALWRDLRRFTDARVGLGRAGTAVPTAAHLDFQEAHARARDAVWSALDVAALEAAIGLPVTRVHSNAPDRRTYLLRPDLGRRLADGAVLPQAPGSVAIVIAAWINWPPRRPKRQEASESEPARTSPPRSTRCATGCVSSNNLSAVMPE